MFSMLTLLISLSMAETTGDSLSGYPQFNVQNFRPSVDAVPYFWVTDSNIPEDAFFYKAVYSYTDTPFTYIDYRGRNYEVVSSLNEIDLIGGLAFDKFRVAAIVPMYVNATGFRSDQLADMVTTGVSSDPISESTSLGDLSVDAKYQIQKIGAKSTGLFASVRATLPTSNSYLPLGSSGTMIDLELGADKQVSTVHLSANIGHRQVQQTSLENQSFGSSLYGRLGGGYQKDPEKSGLALEYVTGTLYGTSGTIGQEVVASTWAPVKGNILRLGVGLGLGQGVSTPKYRLLASIQPHITIKHDSDGDGISDNDDACPTIPEDIDGVKDSDGCIDLTNVIVKFIDGKDQPVEGVKWTVGEQSGKSGDSFEWQVLDNGQATITAEASGFVKTDYTVDIQNLDTTEVTVQLIADIGTLTIEAINEEGVVIEGGWIIKGRKPNIRMTGTQAELKSGEYNIQVRAKGYKPVTQKVSIEVGSDQKIQVQLETSMANVDGNKITISDSVYFETGSHVILEKSHALLDDVVHIIQEHPSIVRLEIEGHTDSVGDNEKNRKLSQERAEAVKQYLINQGVQESRLHAVGYGEDKPIASNDTEEGRTLNRRVHFHIAEQDHEKEHHD